MSQVVEGPVTDHLHSQHDERPDLDYCSICMADMEAAHAEHAWMGRAVKTWTGGNPYGPSDPQSPERDWYIDGGGYVRKDA